jgi:hypothetical protein
MNRLLLLLHVIALFLVADTTRTVAEADPFWLNGNDLWEKCRSNPYGDFCVSYIMGVADQMIVSNARKNGVVGFHACFRTTTTRGQIADVVTQWLQNHPAVREAIAADLVGAALEEAFPCTP